MCSAEITLCPCGDVASPGLLWSLVDVLNNASSATGRRRGLLCPFEPSRLRSCVDVDGPDATGAGSASECISVAAESNGYSQERRPT
jgi:hypothetical protein